jgi:hypothetical protein
MAQNHSAHVPFTTGLMQENTNNLWIKTYQDSKPPNDMFSHGELAKTASIQFWINTNLKICHNEDSPRQSWFLGTLHGIVKLGLNKP